MLDRNAFVEELQALADRFNRDVSDTLAKRYYDELQALTTDEFMAAAKVIYRTDQFWPPPARFLEVAGKDAVTVAQDAWAEVRDAALGGALINARNDWPPDVRKALKYIGGLKEIAHCKNGDLPFIEKRFRKALETIQERGGLPELDKAETPSLPGLYT